MRSRRTKKEKKKEKNNYIMMTTIVIVTLTRITIKIITIMTIIIRRSKEKGIKKDNGKNNKANIMQSKETRSKDEKKKTR